MSDDPTVRELAETIRDWASDVESELWGIVLNHEIPEETEHALERLKRCFGDLNSKMTRVMLRGATGTFADS